MTTRTNSVVMQTGPHGVMIRRATPTFLRDAAVLALLLLFALMIDVAPFVLIPAFPGSLMAAAGSRVTKALLLAVGVLVGASLLVVVLVRLYHLALDFWTPIRVDRERGALTRGRRVLCAMGDVTDVRVEAEDPTEGLKFWVVVTFGPDDRSVRLPDRQFTFGRDVEAEGFASAVRQLLEPLG